MTAANKSKSILNGVVGDYLDATANGLAIDMGFYRNGNLVHPDKLNLQPQHSTDPQQQQHIYQQQHTDPLPLRICILVHGLTDDESTWQYPYPNNNNNDDADNKENDYGQCLQRDLGLQPLYLRYNTGLHISTNGTKLSQLMEELMLAVNDNSDDDNSVQDIVFVCHSMGGLVTRSACLEAAKRQRPWVKKVRNIIFLGTPHHGSYWEQAGHVVSYALSSVPRPYMRLAADVANLRSAGIKDLRYGYVQPEDWHGTEPDVLFANTKQSAALLDWVQYHIITGTITKNPQHPVSLCLGDALVRKDSAVGRSSNCDHDLGISVSQTREFPGVGHTRLTRDPNIYQQIKEWIEMPGVAPPTEWEVDVSMMEDSSTTVLCLGAEEEGNNGERMIPATAPTSASKWAHCKGVATLVQTVVDKGATAVEEVQNELTSEVYGILTRIPPIAPTVRTVQVVHETCVGGIYNIIRGVNRGVGAITQLTFDTMDEVSAVDVERGTTTSGGNSAS